MIIECAEDCGNAPRKNLLKRYNIAYAQNDFDFCLEWVADDIVWEMIGEQRFEGKQAFEKALAQMKENEVQMLQIHQIITHGNVASANGTLTFVDGKQWAYCDVYQFRGFSKTAKIRTISSYVIPIS